MALNRKGFALKSMYEANGARGTCLALQEALADGEIRAEDFSLRELAEALVSPDWVRSLDPRHSGFDVLEAGGGAVDSTAFLNITGQLIFSKMMEAYSAPVFIGDSLCSTVPTPLLDGEKIPGFTDIQGEAEAVGENMPIPELGFGEDYINTPATVKNALIVSITKEAVLRDLTGRILSQAATVGERIAMAKEKRILDCVLGVVNNYSRKGTSYNTYLTTGLWINSRTSGGELIDWTDVEEAEQLFTEMVNPYQSESEPILVVPNTILVMPAKLHTAKQIVHATSLETATASAAQTRVTANSVSNYTVLSSILAHHRLVKSGVSAADAKKTWYMGDFKKAFNYMEVYPLKTEQAPPNNPAEFERDVVGRFKGSERGVCAVVEPRAVSKHFG